MELSLPGVSHRFVTVNGIRMHVAVAGSGPLVVLLHGFPEMWWSWREQIPALVAAGFTVAVPDQRGYNATDARGPYDLDTLRDDIAALIRTLGDAPAALVVGHDWGAMVAWHLAATRPDLVKKVAVINGPHPGAMAWALRHRAAQLRRSFYVFLFQIPWLPEWLLTRDDAQLVARVVRANARDRTHLTDDAIAPYRAQMRRPGAASAMLAWYRAAVRDGLVRLVRPPPEPEIRMPALVVWGMHDPALGFDDLVPPLRRWVPSLRVEKIDDAGHFAHEERPERVNELLLAFAHA